MGQLQEFLKDNPGLLCRVCDCPVILIMNGDERTAYCRFCMVGHLIPDNVQEETFNTPFGYMIISLREIPVEGKKKFAALFEDN